MEKELAQGSVGDVKVSLNAGKVRLEASGAAPGDAGVSAGAFIECDGEKLLSKLFVAIEEKLPDGVDPIAETVKDILIKALKAVG